MPELGWQEQYQGTGRRAGMKRNKMWLHIVNPVNIRKGARTGCTFRITKGKTASFCFYPGQTLENYIGFSHSVPFASETLLTLCDKSNLFLASCFTRDYSILSSQYIYQLRTEYLCIDTVAYVETLQI